MDGLSFDRNLVALSEVTVNNNRLAVTYPVNWFVNEGRSHALGPNYSDLYWPTQPTSQTHECAGWPCVDVLPRSLTVIR